MARVDQKTAARLDREAAEARAQAEETARRVAVARGVAPVPAQVEAPADDPDLTTADGFAQFQLDALASQFGVRKRSDLTALPFGRMCNQPLLREAAAVLGIIKR